MTPFKMVAVCWAELIFVGTVYGVGAETDSDLLNCPHKNKLSPTYGARASSLLSIAVRP